MVFHHKRFVAEKPNVLSNWFVKPSHMFRRELLAAEYLRDGSTAKIFILFAKCFDDLESANYHLKKMIYLGEDFADHFDMSCANARTITCGMRVAKQ